MLKWPTISLRAPGPMAWVGSTTRRPSTVMPTRARRVWPVRLCTSVRTSTCAGHPAQSWRGQGLGADDVQVAGGAHRDLAVDAAEVPPHAVAVAVEAGRAPVGQVGAGAPGGHTDRQLVGTAPQSGQHGLERHVVTRVAGDLAAVQVDGGVVAGALEAHHPACSGGLAGQGEVALVPADPGAVGARLARVPVVRHGHAPPAVVPGRPEVPRAAQRQPPGLALADRRPPAGSGRVRGRRGHGAGPGQGAERSGHEDGGEQYAAFHRDDDHSPETPALRNLHLRAKCENYGALLAQAAYTSRTAR